MIAYFLKGGVGAGSCTRDRSTDAKKSTDGVKRRGFSNNINDKGVSSTLSYHQ